MRECADATYKITTNFNYTEKMTNSAIKFHGALAFDRMTVGITAHTRPKIYHVIVLNPIILTVVRPCVIQPIVILLCNSVDCHSAKHHSVDCHFAEHHSVECHYCDCYSYVS
jgi:hypothetical protein